ncbi:MAG: tyrosine-type recombinase/integrase, partial [Clostridia bacterium]|nr:tyrosine-type recombinase/integrase [Clostridia bacterium]
MKKYTDVPQIVRDFLMYIQVVRGESKVTGEDYYFDLRTFFRYMKMEKLGLKNVPFENIDIGDIDIEFIRSITLSDIYEFLFYLENVRNNSARSRSRRISCLRTFFKYLTKKVGLLQYNPIEELDSPALPKSLPKYLELDDSIKLLESVDGPNRLRDYAILTIFLNCGLRLSELVGLDLSDISGDFITVNGKGNKQRSIFLNEACKSAINDYLTIRPKEGLKDKSIFARKNILDEKQCAGLSSVVVNLAWPCL